MSLWLICSCSLPGLSPQLEKEASKKMYLWAPPTNKFPEGRKDDTHLNVEGASLVAKLAAQQLILMDNSLAKRIVNFKWRPDPLFFLVKRIPYIEDQWKFCKCFFRSNLKVFYSMRF